MTHIGRRVLGVITLLAAAVVYDANSDSLLQRLAVPGVMAVSAWLIVQNLTAVLLAVTLIAITRTDFASAEPLASRVYPGIALVAGVGLGTIALARFRARIVATRADRWRHRGPGAHEDGPSSR